MPRLLIRKGEGMGRDQAVGISCVVGRDLGADFMVEDHLMSRRHLRVFQEAGAWFVEDLGSTNGTRLNGTKVARAPLRDGDAILAGGTELVFVQKDLLGGPVPGGAPPLRRRRSR